MNLAKAHVIDQTFDNILDLEKGFSCGTIFASLKDEYKKINIEIKNTMDERKKVLYIIDVYSFAINDLVLFLDTHPEDKNALELCNKIRIELIKVYNYYNENFPALTLFTAKETYDYIYEPWPWEDRF